jgi:hypothetical protein
LFLFPFSLIFYFITNKHSWHAWVDGTSISADAKSELKALLAVPIKERGIMSMTKSATKSAASSSAAVG